MTDVIGMEKAAEDQKEDQKEEQQQKERRMKGKNMSRFSGERFKGVIDVTKPPYNADNTGKIDCTKILQQILDDILAENIRGMKETYDKLMAMPDPNAKISFEICKNDGIPDVIFPERLPYGKIIYFPNGTYLVSDTVSYSHENLCNIVLGLPGYELSRQIYFKGESRDGVTIKLKDYCPGFEYGADKPVVSFMRGEMSNVAMTNTFEDITIDIGEGNSGASGMVFFANNTGSIKNVRIISSDPEYRGYAGLEIRHEIVSGCYVRNLEVIGFRYGIRIIPARHYVTLEHIKLKHQKKAGIFINNTMVMIKEICSINLVPAVRIDGNLAHVIVADGELLGGHPLDCGIVYSLGSCYVRNVRSEGYKSPVGFREFPRVDGNYVSEFSNEDTYSLFDGKGRTLNLQAEEVPDIPWTCEETQKAFSDEYGAVGDGICDDTKAIQELMNSGKKEIFFHPGEYLINDTIVIPSSVERVNFMYCSLAAGEKLKTDVRSVFCVTGESKIPLVIEDVFAWEKFYGRFHFIEHAGTRTLILSDLHIQTAALYFNSKEGGKVFIENCACTVGDDAYREICPFAFIGQTVYARNINPERAECEILNDHGSLWMMGFKTEGYGTTVRTINGGITEILGGVASMGENKELPVIVNENSDVSAILSTNGYWPEHIFRYAVKEVRGEQTRFIGYKELPMRLLNCFKLPLYSGYGKRD